MLSSNLYLYSFPLAKKLREEQAIMFIFLFSASEYYKLLNAAHSEFGEYVASRNKKKIQ